MHRLWLSQVGVLETGELLISLSMVMKVSDVDFIVRRRTKQGGISHSRGRSFLHIEKDFVFQYKYSL